MTALTSATSDTRCIGIGIGAGQAVIAVSSRARRRASRSAVSLATMPSTAHRIIVGAQRLAKILGEIRAGGPSRWTHATAAGTRSSAARASAPGRSKVGTRFDAHLVGAQQAGGENTLRRLGHIEDRRGGHGDWKREPGAIVPTPTHYQRNQRHQLLAILIADDVVHLPRELRQQRVGAARVIAPPLTRQEGGELHEAGATARGAVLAAGEDRYAVRSSQ